MTRTRTLVHSHLLGNWRRMKFNLTKSGCSFVEWWWKARHVNWPWEFELDHWGALIYRVSQEERSIFWEVIVSVVLRNKVIWTCVLFLTVSDIWRAVFWTWRAIFSFPPAIMRHYLKLVKRQLAVVIVVDSSRYFRSYDRTKLPRISAKWITRTTRECSFGYTDCYVLSAWRSPSSLYPTCDATSHWHFP
jgi:hypothetical protein